MVSKLSQNHPVKLQGLQGNAFRVKSGAPTLLQRPDIDPIAGVLGELSKPDLSVIARTQINSPVYSSGSFSSRIPTNPLQLYQPIHRTFHLVLLEAVCAPYNSPDFQPRLAADKIDSAGLVIRRVTPDSEGNLSKIEGWRTLSTNSTSSTAKIEGWRALSEEHKQQDPEKPQLIGYTPAATTAPIASLAGHRLTLHPTQTATLKDAVETAYTERTTPLFLAPPEVCDRHKKTILYGLIPLTSSAISQSQLSEPPFKANFIQSHINRFLQATPLLSDNVLFRGSNQKSNSRTRQNTLEGTIGGTFRDIDNPFQTFFEQANTGELVSANLILPTIPYAGEPISGRTAARRTAKEQLSQEEANLTDFLALIRQVAVEFEFDKAENDTAKLTGLSRRIYEELNNIKVRHEGEEKGAGDVLFISRSLLDSNSTESVNLPEKWGYVSSEIANKLILHVTDLLNQRADISTPQIQQFDDLNATYQVSAFIRVRRPDGCPPQIHWSEPSEPFTIRPWYDNSLAPPVQVPLPDLLSDKNLLKQLKPNVAFNIPAGLFNQIEGMTLQDLLEGKKPASGGLGIGWICGFNIPIITICAFIVLNIFLVLLNFIFGWLPFIKICVPIPQRNQGGN